MGTLARPAPLQSALRAAAQSTHLPNGSSGGWGQGGDTPGPFKRKISVWLALPVEYVDNTILATCGKERPLRVPRKYDRASRMVLRLQGEQLLLRHRQSTCE